MKKIVFTLFLVAVAATVYGQKLSTYDQYIEDELIDYSLILRYKDSINLTNDQLASIKSFYAENGFNFDEKSKDYQRALSKLQELVESDAGRTDILTSFNSVLKLENEIKRNRLKFLLHSREILNDSQRNTLRLIGRSNSLVIRTSGPDGVLSGYFADIKPIYKIVDQNNNISYVKEGMLNELDVSKIQTIDVEKGVNLTIDGEKFRDRNLITIKTSESPLKETVRLYVRGKNAQEVDNIDEPLIVLHHKGKTVSLKGSIKDSFIDLEPSFIQSITVLKGESAISKYGKEGENGVILIYLKKEAQYEIE